MPLESLIGFDAREMWINDETFWASECREMFLLDQMVAKPLSADDTVWPAVFDMHPDFSLPHDVRWRQGLWSSHQQLESVLRTELVQAQTPYWVIAISQYRENESEELLYEATEAINYESWQFLGFDVCNETLLSGLMNFGGDQDEMRYRRSLFTAKVNEHHLFSNPDDAFAYRQWGTTEDDFVVHGPFYIFGLYAVSKRDQ
jgi:hypothetical protein